MLGQGQVQSLKLDGQPTSLGSKFSAKLDQVSQLVGFGQLYTYLSVLLLEITFAITNSTAGDITIDWPKLYDILTGVILSFKAADTQLWEFTQAGGQAIWQTFYQKFGILPLNQTNVTIVKDATATVYMKFPLTFFSPDFDDDQEAELIWAELLVQSVIEFTLAGTGIFGANVTYTVTPTLSCYAVPRAERYFPTLVRHTEWAQSNFNQDNVPVNGNFPIDTVLMPYHAAGVTARTFDAADISSVNLVYDGTPVFSQTPPSTMQTLGMLFPQPSADRQGQWEAGGNRMLALTNADRMARQRSKILFASKQPIVRFVGDGTLTIDQYRVLLRMIVPSGKSSAKAAFKAIGLEAADDELAPRFALNPTSDPSILQVLPWTYSPKAKSAA